MSGQSSGRQDATPAACNTAGPRELPVAALGRTRRQARRHEQSLGEGEQAVEGEGEALLALAQGLLGAGAAGRNSAELAAAAGANVIVFEKRPDRLREMMNIAPNITALYPYEETVARELMTADLVIGAVLIPSAKAPHVVTRKMVKSMEPGSVLVDISIDQGGCFETSRPTTYADPTYVVDGVTHFCVTNMPGAVPQTSSQAICAAILPYVNRLIPAERRPLGPGRERLGGVEGAHVVEADGGHRPERWVDAGHLGGLENTEVQEIKVVLPQARRRQLVHGQLERGGRGHLRTRTARRWPCGSGTICRAGLDAPGRWCR